MYHGLIPYGAEEVHDGYFSADKKKGKIVELLDTSGSTAKDDETYALIMKDKGRLLSADVPLRFIFSHSALKEGWDNPNVFQICTLREMGTDRERRQTIERGLRLPVNQYGDRICDDQVNRLTVIANETFENFAKGLQSDIEAAIDPNGGFKFGRVPPIAGQFYEMRLFEIQEVEEYLTRFYTVKSTDNRTPYDFIAYDSATEEEVAGLLDGDDRVKFFCKLPRWFKVATPLGGYNPDWAVVVEDSQKLYLVRETKSTLDRDKRRENENKKVDCGKAHFKALGVNFKDATTIHEILQA